MKKYLILFFACITLSFAQSPSKVALVVGGNGKLYESDSFQPKLKELSDALRKKGWEVRQVRRGEEEVSRFEELLTHLDDFKNLPSGSELLIPVLTHGSPATTRNDHAWDFEDGIYPVTTPSFTQKLKELKDLGIKIAVLDASCFSGATTRDLGQLACVVSGTSSTRVSRGESVIDTLIEMLNSTPEKLSQISLNNPLAPLTMEELFLYTLVSYPTRVWDAQQPEISDFSVANEAADLVTALTTNKKAIVDFTERAGLHYSEINLDSLTLLVKQMIESLAKQPGSWVKHPDQLIMSFLDLGNPGDPGDDYYKRSAWNLGNRLVTLVPEVIRLREESQDKGRIEWALINQIDKLKAAHQDTKELEAQYAISHEVAMKATREMGAAFGEMERSLSYLRTRYYLNRKKNGETSSACAEFSL